MISQNIVNPRLQLESSPSFFKKKSHKVDFAILSAMPEELSFYKEELSDGFLETVSIDHLRFEVYEYRNNRILLACTGLGTTFAAAMTTLVHHHFRPDYIFFSGTAGAINPDLKLCDVVIAEKAFEAEIQDLFELVTNTPFESCLTHPLNNRKFPNIFAADKDLVSIASTVFPATDIHKGTVVSSNTFPAPQELFNKIKNNNAYSIDMETSAIYQIAWLLNIRVLAIRGISNILNHDGTDDNVHESDVTGSAKAAGQVVLKIVDKVILQNIAYSEAEKSTESENRALELIKHFNLQRHPEGGYYYRTYQSSDNVKSTDPSRYNDESRSAGTSIYYLLCENDFSSWHRLKSDEIWHHYKGCAIKIHVLQNDGALITHLLGDPTISQAASFQIAITSGNWFAAELADKSSYCLVGCTVNPGFDFSDFEMANRATLSTQFPQHSHIIAQLTHPSPEEEKEYVPTNTIKVCL